MRLQTQIYVLTFIIMMLLVLSSQRHAKLNATVDMLKDFQKRSAETRLHFMNELDELQNRLAAPEHANGIPHVRTVRPTDTATGNRK